MDDFNNPRVQAHACAAVVNFAGGCWGAGLVGAGLVGAGLVGAGRLVWWVLVWWVLGAGLVVCAVAGLDLVVHCKCIASARGSASAAVLVVWVLLH
jgi:hypothetical protein